MGSGVGFSGLASTTTTTSSPSAVWKKIKFEGEGPQSAWTHCACVVEHGTKCIVLGGMKGQDWMLNELQELSIIKNTTAGRNTTAVAAAANAAAAEAEAAAGAGAEAAVEEASQAPQPCMSTVFRRPIRVNWARVT